MCSSSLILLLTIFKKNLYPIIQSKLSVKRVQNIVVQNINSKFKFLTAYQILTGGKPNCKVSKIPSRITAFVLNNIQTLYIVAYN